MRLLNIRTLELGEFVGTSEEPIPPYIILSHTWADNEVTYSEMMAPTSDTLKKAGYVKIQKFAAAVAEQTADRYDPISYVWIDTCCIDKSSSAELSEAINSMYRWYKDADSCYVYLFDMEGFIFDHEYRPWNTKEVSEYTSHLTHALQNCRWMTRGWTLQELLANSEVMFFNREWKFMFTKSSYIAEFSMLLGIGRDVLKMCNPNLASVAQRMSWASRRLTTRAEDMAYCLLGIFDVSMPLLYGEGGEKAFIRLQEEIMKNSDDQSLFAWRNSEKQYATFYGLLASSPAKFAKSGNVAFVDDPDDNAPFSVTNKGLSLTLPLVRVSVTPRRLDIGLLNCREPGPDGEQIGIYLMQLDGSQYARIEADELWTDGSPQSPWEEEQSLVHFFIRQNIRFSAHYHTSLVGGFLITEDITTPDMYRCEVSPNVTSASDHCFITISATDSGMHAFLCYSSYKDTTMGAVVIILMWDHLSGKFGVKFHYYRRWSGETNVQSRLEYKRLLQEVGPPMDEVSFYAAGSHRVASTDMQLGLMDHLAVIKVAIRIK